MKNFHSIKATVFAKQGENLEEIKTALKKFFPIDLEKEKIKIKVEKATGFEDKKIEIILIKITKSRNIKLFLKKLFGKLTKIQIQQILDELKTRIDEEGFFYLRFDKDSWVKDEILFITDSGNCYHMKFKIAAYPCNKEKALEVMREFLQNIFKDKS